MAAFLNVAHALTPQNIPDFSVFSRGARNNQ
jgi:hypothetical protein